MNSPLPYDVMSIIYKQLDVEDKSNLIDALLIFQIWFSADLIKELRCKRGCVRCVPDGHTELRILNPNLQIKHRNRRGSMRYDDIMLDTCNICKIYNSVDDFDDDMYGFAYLNAASCDICKPYNVQYCRSCARANDDFKMCEGCQAIILYNKKCTVHYDPLVTLCTDC
jgi:hypothetical protein